MKVKNSWRLLLTFCLAGAFLYVFPLLLANKYYSDDMLRYTTGLDWSMDGRPLSSIIMKLLSGGEKVKDLFPYTTILGAFLISLGGYCISLVLELEKNKTLKYSSFLLLVSPLMIENLSYRYDVFAMGLSVIFVTIPFLWKDNFKKFMFFSVLGVYATLLTYQASVVIYVLLALAVLIKYCFEEQSKKIFSQLAYFVLPVILGYILTLFTGKIFSLDYGGRDKTVFSGNFSENISNNWNAITNLLGFVFKSIHYSVFFAILFIVLLYGLIRFVREKNITLSNKLLGLLFLTSVPFVVVSIPLLLEKTFIAPRIFISFSFLVYVSLIFINRYRPKLTTLFSVFYILIALPLMASYTKYLNEQNDFQELVVLDIMSNVDIDNKQIVFDGELPISEYSELSINNYVFVRWLYINFLGNENFMLKEYFMSKTSNLYSPVFLKAEERQELLSRKNEIPIVHKTNYYYVRSDAKSILIDFNKQGIKSVDLNTVEFSEEIIYGIDSFTFGSEVVNIRGFAFYEKLSSEDSKIEIIFIKDNENAFVSELLKEKRKDVSDYFKGNYDDSGFYNNFNLSEFPKGNYKVGVLVKNKHKEKYNLTDKTFSVE